MINRNRLNIKERITVIYDGDLDGVELTEFISRLGKIKIENSRYDKIIIKTDSFDCSPIICFYGIRKENDDEYDKRIKEEDEEEIRYRKLVDEVIKEREERE